MLSVEATHTTPIVLRPVEAPSRADSWREEVAGLVTSAEDAEVLQGFVAGLMGEVLDQFVLHREFQRGSGTVEWEYWRGRNSTIADFRRQRAAIRENYQL